MTVKTSKKKQVIDITDDLNKQIGAAGIVSGLCYVFVKHTTASVTTADLDPGTDLDLIDALEAMVPRLSYRHPHDPSHVGDHIMSSIIGPHVTVPIGNYKLDLGLWQRVVLIELDGPRSREVVVSFIPTKR